MNDFKFNLGKLISNILLLCGLVMSGNVFVYAAPDDFGRLFTTPEERKNLQVLRYSEPEAEEMFQIIIDDTDEVTVGDTEPRNLEAITLKGIVYRKGSKSTVWLNSSNSYEGSLATEYFRINKGDIDSNKVSVTVPEASLEFDLKVGETYDPNDESLIDIVESGNEITISGD